VCIRCAVFTISAWSLGAGRDDAGCASVFPGSIPSAFVLRRSRRALHRAARCATMFIGGWMILRSASSIFVVARTGIMAGFPCPIALMHRVVTEMHMPSDDMLRHDETSP